MIKNKMKFKDAPIGARFKIPGSNGDNIWIKMNSYPKGPHYDGNGEIVLWNGNVKGHQKFCCWVDEVNGYDFDTEIELIDYEKQQDYIDELFDLASDNLCGLAHDELHEIVEKYMDI